MVSIIMQRRRDLVVAKSLKGEKVLKLCARCRHNKTKCDAVATRPYPCTFCAKKNLVCVLDTTQPSKRNYDLAERLVSDVQDLHRKLDAIVDKKTRLVQQLLQQSVPTESPVSVDLNVLDSPGQTSDNEAIYIDPIPTLSLSDSFTIHLNLTSEPWTVSYTRAEALFHNFEQNFRGYLPILPKSFFQKNLHDVHRESDLLFWSIVVTSLLNQSPQEYFQLALHVQNLVVVNCWFNTPRSLYSLVALLILTTWPLPDERSLKIQDNIAIKYISLMKNLSLQFGLHKLNFIDEFSKKTNMEVDNKSGINNMIRERIYKYVNINSNYWLVFLGLSNSSYNGSHQDYIINKAANKDIFDKASFKEKDNFINSLLKVSLIQLKMNENMNDLLENPSKVGKLIHLNMFEKILNSYNSKDVSPLVDNDLIALSVEFSKLQLYIYYFSTVDITLSEYRCVIYRTVICCKKILDLFEGHFTGITNFNQVPIHYRFSVELASLVLMDIHSCPLLNSVEDYLHVKQQFLRSYSILTKDSQWSYLNSKLFKIIHKYDECDRAKLMSVRSKNGSFFLINKMSNYLVSGLHYEVIWHIYQTEKMESVVDFLDIKWDIFGLKENSAEHQRIINYISGSGSIFK